MNNRHSDMQEQPHHGRGAEGLRRLYCHLAWLGCLAIAAACTSGCARPDTPPPQELTKKSIASPREILNSVGVPKAKPRLEPMVKLQPQVAMENEFPYEGRLFSLSVRDTPLGDVLMALAAEADLNLIMDKDVDREEPISIEFNNIPLKNALDNLMAVHDYFYTIKKGVLRVSGLQQRVFKIDYPLMRNNTTSEVGGDILDTSSGGSNDSETLRAAQNTNIKGEFTIKAEVADKEHLDIWKQIEDALKPPDQNTAGLLSTRGWAEINRMGGIILVRDRPSNLKAVEKFLDQIQSALRRQVVIEAKIVEVTLDKGHQYGINWEELRLPFAHILPNGSLHVSTNLGELSSQGTFSLTFNDPVGEDTGRMFLNALATNGQVNILSSPRLNVLNNQSAFITVGKIVPFKDYSVEKFTEKTNSGGEVTTIRTVPTINRFSEGVSLGITPQINENGETILHVVPIITEQTGNETIEINGEVANIPVVSIRESDTTVRVEDRTTIVIGGLIAEKTNDTIKKVPGLGDIPGLGWAFSHQERQSRKTELVIMLTTTVVTR